MKFLALGTHPDLSLAEIYAFLNRNVDLSRSTKDAVLIDDDSLASSTLVSTLSGVIKAGQIVGKLDTWDADKAEELIFQAISAGERNKISFGISVYDGDNRPFAKNIMRDREKLGLSVKKRLKALDRPVRLVTSREAVLSSVIVSTNHLLDGGGEIVLIPFQGALYIGKTEAVQDFQAWSRRDFGRPARDTRSGMLPPKLARLMVNLTGLTPANSRLLDPFCGSGTVLMEASLLGYASVAGSDISEKAMADTDMNMKWLTEVEHSVLPPLELAVTAAEHIDRKISREVDAVVTETYLGPPLKGNESPQALGDSMRALMNVYRASFPAVFHLIKSGGKAVIAFPVFRERDDWRFVPLADIIRGTGMRVVDPLPAQLPSGLRVLTQNGGLLYARPDQRVGREIVVLERR